ncbi:hypothetical protein AVEN_238112-1 [Araneus ventricosus]|uniref:Uncharacterized protein n=1 Tax=Araneus ventricosus TaxID=182803 RepID=A0A4Y2GHN4_ARAVE|nr:hypothetical protein AVEN_238112-1 [Araneus ventricosus]
MKSTSKLLTLKDMLSKKVNGYQKVPMTDIGAPVQILLCTPDDSEGDDDVLDSISDVIEENENNLSVQESTTTWGWPGPLGFIGLCSG